jgi:hypothetical protein
MPNSTATAHPVVHLDDLLALLHRHQCLVLRKVLHRLLNAAQQLPRPHDVACDGWHVARHWRLVLEGLVLRLHSLQVFHVVVEDDLPDSSNMYSTGTQLK